MTNVCDVELATEDKYTIQWYNFYIISILRLAMSYNNCTVVETL